MYFVLRSALEDVNFRFRRERRIPYKVCELLILYIRNGHFRWSRVCRACMIRGVNKCKVVQTSHKWVQVGRISPQRVPY